MARLRFNSKHIKFGTKRATRAVSADVAITVNRALAPVRAASDRFLIGVTFTHHTFPSGSNSTSVANAKTLLAALNLDLINMHSHGFGQDGPLSNTDKAAGRTYADRASWAGWSAWDVRMNHMRGCAGGSVTPQYIISLLPPGWCKMDGGSKTTAASDPLAAGRTWDNIDSDTGRRHTDAHRTHMVELAQAIALRHSDVAYFSVFNEQKGNFMPPNSASGNYAAEIASDGLSGISNYFEQERYQEALRTGLDSVGKTGVELMGPYLVVEGGGHATLAAAYAGDGFPQPSTVASIPGNTYKTLNPDTLAPIASRTRTFLEQWYSRTSAASRNSWYALDWKVMDGDNDQPNWDVLFPFRWYFFEMVRETLQELKTVTGWQSTDRMIGMETYWRKVQDETNIPTDAEQGAMAAENLRVELEEGVKAHLRWAPEQGVGQGNRCNLFTTTTLAPGSGGAQAYPTYDTYKLFCDHFRGVNVYAAGSSNDKVVTAVANGSETLLINHTNASKTVSINGAAPVTLTAYEVLVVSA
jgi:hypothetical protein